MEKTTEYFEQWRKSLDERYELFRKFKEAEEERKAIFYNSDSELHFDITKETASEWHRRVVVGMADEWNAACDADQKRWYKNMSMFSGIKLWDSLTEEQQRWYRGEKIEKWRLIHDCRRIIEDEIEDFVRQYNCWHFEKYGWCAVG